MSDINFCNTKEQLNHLGEVVTGKVDGSPTGADIDTSTLPYTGQVRKTLPALEEEYQADIDNFVQVSDQLIVDKSEEFDASIANKEAEADAAIDSYRLLSKGDYAPGILLSNKFEFIEYNGESYFAVNPPYTTTATTPDVDGNLFIGNYATKSYSNTQLNSGDSQIVESLIFPTDPAQSLITGPQSTIVSFDSSALRLNTLDGSAGSVIYHWAPSGSLPSAPYVITNIQENTTAGYVVTADGVDYEFITKRVENLRVGNVFPVAKKTAFVEGWGFSETSDPVVNANAIQLATDNSEGVVGFLGVGERVIGGEITLKDNTLYDFNSSITLKLIPNWRATTGVSWVFKTTSNAPNSASPIAAATRNIRFKGARFDGNTNSYGAGNRVPNDEFIALFIFGSFNDSSTTQVSDVEFDGCYFNNIAGDAILPYLGDNYRLKDCHFDTLLSNEALSAGTCFHGEGTSGVNISGGSYRHDAAKGDSWHCFTGLSWSGKATKDYMITGFNLINNTFGHFASFEPNDISLGAENVVVSKNIAHDIGLGFIHIPHASNVSVVGNISNNIGAYFAKFEGSSDINFGFNQIKNTAYTAFVCNSLGGGAVTIANNTCRNIGKSGTASDPNPLNQGGCIYINNGSQSKEGEVIIKGNTLNDIWGAGILVNNFVIAKVDGNTVLNFGQEPSAPTRSMYGIRVAANAASITELSSVSGNSLYSTTAQYALLNVESCNTRDNDIAGSYSVAKYYVSSRPTRDGLSNITNISFNGFDLIYERGSNFMSTRQDSFLSSGLPYTNGDIQYINSPAIGGSAAYVAVDDGTGTTRFKEWGVIQP